MSVLLFKECREMNNKICFDGKEIIISTSKRNIYIVNTVTPDKSNYFLGLEL